MKYSDRYKTVTIRFTPDEYKNFIEKFKERCEQMGFDISQHKFLKLMLKKALYPNAGKIII